MRAAAAVMVTAAGLCIGLLRRDKLHRRVQIWTELCLFLREVRLRTRLHEPLDAQIDALSESRALEHLTFLRDCAAEIRAGRPLPQAWSSAVALCFRAQHLTRAQAKMLAQWIPSLSAADSQRAEGLLELYETRAAQALSEAEQTEASVGALCVRVWFAVGLLLGILIL